MRRANTVSVVSFVISSVTVAIVVGAGLGVVGSLLEVPVELIVGVAVASLLSVSPVGPLRLPSSSWRVPMHWGGPSRWRNGAYFGAPLGAGFVTALPGAGLYSVAATCLVLPTPAGAAVFGAFGLARSVPLVTAWLFAYDDERDTLPLEALGRARGTIRAEVVLLVALAGVALLQIPA